MSEVKEIVGASTREGNSALSGIEATIPASLCVERCAGREDALRSTRRQRAALVLYCSGVVRCAVCPLVVRAALIAGCWSSKATATAADIVRRRCPRSGIAVFGCFAIDELHSVSRVSFRASASVVVSISRSIAAGAVDAATAAAAIHCLSLSACDTLWCRLSRPNDKAEAG